MAEKTMKEAVDMEEFEAWQQGRARRKEPPKEMPEYAAPNVPGLLTIDKLKLENVVAVPKGRHRMVRNAEKVMFPGFDVAIAMKDGTRLEGWMSSKDFHEMRRILFRGGKVAMQNVEF